MIVSVQDEEQKEEKKRREEQKRKRTCWRRATMGSQGSKREEVIHPLGVATSDDKEKLEGQPSSKDCGNVARTIYNNNQSPLPLQFGVCIVGDTMTGKTALTQRFVTEKLPSLHYDQAIGSALLYKQT